MGCSARRCVRIVDSVGCGMARACTQAERLLAARVQKLEGASVLILANKQDLAGALSAEAIATGLDLRSEQFENRHWTIKGCSAVTGEGLVDGMDWIVADIASRIFMLA